MKNSAVRFKSLINLNYGGIRRGAALHLLSCRRKSTSSLKESYLMGPGDIPLCGRTIGQTFSRAADLFGDREAVVSCHQSIRKTFVQVNKEGEELASGLLALGFQPGDRIGIWGPNSYEWYLTEIAAAKAGLILVNINPSYRPNELKYCLNKVSVKGIICADKFKTSDYYKLLLQIAPEVEKSTACNLKCRDVPCLDTVIMISEETLSGTVRFKDVLNAGGSETKKKIEELSDTVQFDQPCNIQFTSGTTGLPKAALLSHHNMVNNGYYVGKRCGYDKFEARICLSVPLYHCFGCVIGVLGACQFGGAVIMPSAGFDAKAINKALKDEKVTNCYGTPTMFVDILDEFKKNSFDTKYLRGGITAGASCPEELLLELFSTLNVEELINMYGMTETAPVTFQCFPTDPVAVRSTTIGYPVNHTEVKVVDENNKILPIGVAGELCIRGYCNFLGYWGNEEKSKEVIGPDRWLKTGDIVKLNSEGYAEMIGRSKDMIIRGGENIYPAEIENFYMGHPEILEAQIFGLPDHRLGEEVAMWVRKSSDSKITSDEIKKWSKEKIAHYKIPRYILFKDEFPRTITGKIQKFIMKEETIKELQKS